MSIGYACLNVGTPNTAMRSVIKRNATNEMLTQVTQHNLEALEKMIGYNIENNIRLFRISSDLIPFGSSPVNQLAWWNIHHDTFQRIAAKVKKSNMRLSFHPGQYTVLNSPREDVVERAILDLDYHSKVLDCLGSGYDHKIILHVGGVYGDKEEAMARFAENFQRLSSAVKKRLIIENDDRLYNIVDVLTLAETLGIPAVYDNLHHAINPPPEFGSDSQWIDQVKNTWKAEDGKQKIHYSQQASEKRLGAHTQTINLETFLAFYEGLTDQSIDIMLEVKDKNITALKCVNATEVDANISLLEKEWARYKYLVLEKSPADYERIRTLLKDKASYPVRAFYTLIENALAKEIQVGQAENAALHIWGYFKGKATSQEEKRFVKTLENYRNGSGTLATVKRHLLKLATKHQETYLLHSLYFYLE